MAGPTFWYGHNAAFEFDLAPRLLAIRAPLLLLSNTGELLHENTLKAHALRPDARLVTMTTRPGAVVIYEQPERWAAVVLEFLRDGRAQ